METQELLEIAWGARGSAWPWKSGTKVGCAIECSDGSIVVGSNIEGLWMTSIHAEVSAITKVVEKKQLAVKVAIVAKTKSFTPCGACLDWLMQFSTKDCLVITENKQGEIREYRLREDLCPNYPEQ